MAAEKFVRKLKAAVDHLRSFPFSGWMVEEWLDPNVREMVFGIYRIIYRVGNNNVEIITVQHGARQLDEEILKDK